MKNPKRSDRRKNRRHERAQIVSGNTNYFDVSDDHAFHPLDSRKRHRNSYEIRPPHVPQIVPKSETQQHYLDALVSSPHVIAIGAAGGGKTYCGAAHAAREFRLGRFKQIILSRPVEKCGPSLGFLPGDLDAKFGPWLAPCTSVIKQIIGSAAFEIASKREQITMVPLELMRGYSFESAVVLIDECQNITRDQAVMLTTRIAEGSQLIMMGDLKQSDLHEASGLKYLVDLIERRGLPVPVIEFSIDDCVRSPLTRMWLEAHAS